MKRVLALVWCAVVLVVACAGCGGGGAAKKSDTVTLVTHNAFAASKEVLAEFTRQTGYKIKLVQPGDAGVIVNQAILRKGNPLGDVLFGVDNTFSRRASMPRSSMRTRRSTSRSGPG